MRVILVLLLIAATGLCREIPTDHPTRRIINGDVGHISEFPYFATIGDEHDENACGSTILTSRWLLTAAHCLVNSKGEKCPAAWIHVGNVTLPGVKYEIEDKIAHPIYVNSTEVIFDIGLIKMKEPIKFGATVRPAVLWSKKPEAGKVGTIIGRGDTNKKEKDALETLLKGERVLVNTTANVTANMWTIPILKEYTIRTDPIEARIQAVGYGDSGGPLVVDGKVAGVLTLLFGNYESNSGGAYFTSASKVREWIDYWVNEYEKLEENPEKVRWMDEEDEADVWKMEE